MYKTKRDCIIRFSAVGIMMAVMIPLSAHVKNMRCEYVKDPIGIDVPTPRLSWIHSDGDTPMECRVELSQDSLFSSSESYNADDLWTATVNIRPIAGRKYYWRVITKDSKGNNTVSQTAKFETGKFGKDQWSGKWISDSHDVHFEGMPMFRHSFSVAEKPEEGRVYVSALGYYDMYINGQRVGDHHMDPGFTGYDKRSLYVVHDISTLLHKGKNEVIVTLGNGFANCQSRDAWGQEKAPWRSRPQFVCEIFADGKLVDASDENWETALSPYVYNNLYSGDHYDARVVPGKWVKATVKDSPNSTLVVQSMPPIRPVEKINPKLLQSWGDTVRVYDMGKNIAGVCQLKVKGKRNTKVELAHGELLKSDGRLEQGNLAIYYHPLKEDEAFQTDVYILSGNKKGESFQPQFTYHGFRYVEVRTSKPIKEKDMDVTGIMMHTDLPRVGYFRCSNDLLNRIYDATMLSYVDNIHSIPTDCPQREKNGWTADAHVAIDLALQNYDGITFYEKWMNDFADNQKDNGNIAGIVPSAGWGYGDSPGPVWDAGLFIIPLAIYDYYGDDTVLRRMYPSMLKYMNWLKGLEKEDGTLACGIGDWLPYNTQTPTDFTSTLYAYADYKMIARISKIIGEDPIVWEEKMEEMGRRINNKWFDSEKRLYANGSQAAQAISLYWGLVPEEYERSVADNLNNMVVANDYALDFGLLGSKSVLRMLTKYGYPETAYRMATRTSAPSWGHWVDECGYTTLAETWTLSPEFRDASLNHVFFGDIAAWMVNDIAGLNFNPDAPGFSEILIRPVFFKDIDWAEATYESKCGQIRTRWERKGDGIDLKVTVPAGATARIMCGDIDMNLTSGNHSIKI